MPTMTSSITTGSSAEQSDKPVSQLQEAVIAPASAESMQNPVVTREEWLDARKRLLLKEKAMNRELDGLRAERRRLPWVRVEKHYEFAGPQGRVTLADLFQGRSQLAVYHFMLAPESDHICEGCAFIADHVDAARQHFEHADLSFAAISRAPVERIEQVKKRLGWTFPWLSAAGTDFNYDFGVSFTKEDLATGRAIYNYGTVIRKSEDMHGTSIFAKNKQGEIFHTYSTYFRGNEQLIGAFAWLDLAPQGRNEADGIMSWVRLNDEYPKDHEKDCCGAS